MGRLGDLDPDELDNLFSDKTIVYVEGEGDEAVYNSLVGMDVGEFLEFKVPRSGGSGHFAVRDEVHRQRERGNTKVHGLLDGEAAAAFGFVEALIDNRSMFFSLDGPKLSGLLFLAELELENIMLCHADVASFIANQVTFARVGKVPNEVIHADLRQLAQRFYVLAILKFVAGDFHRGGTPCKQVSVHEGMFQSKLTILGILRTLKPKIVAEGLEWSAFLRRMLVLMRRVRAAFISNGQDLEAKERHLTRLADGKGMLKCIYTKFYGGSPAWEGVLSERVRLSPYAEAFRKNLLTRIVNRPAAAGSPASRPRPELGPA